MGLVSLGQWGLKARTKGGDMSLNFENFYTELYEGQRSPFPWQIRFTNAIIQGNWPEVVALPTACGKTGIIESCVFCLAEQSALSAMERTVPLRLVYVVDRRLIVDEVSEHATMISNELESALTDESKPTLQAVAQNLMAYGGEAPLTTVTLRGGMYRDEEWTFSPSSPLICVSTIDQAGSRLLFRGYGISEFQRPVQAGLLGSDALYVLDEAHLSTKFNRTLEDISRYQTQAEHPVTKPIRCIQLTATPKSNINPFELGQEDKVHPLIKARTGAHKNVTLKKVKELSTEAVSQALRLAKSKSTEVVGVVVNRVATAREIFTALKERPDIQTILLTGRIRPHDKDCLLREILPKLATGTRYKRKLDTPLIVVATQSIEVGANLDFDALVTQSAPLSSLKQRFGRLDRLGELGETNAVILHEKGGPKSDPIYGADLQESWKWLRNAAKEYGQKKNMIDLGIDSTNSLLDELGPPPEIPESESPVFLPGFLQLWSQTSPSPCPDPDVGLFLHGPQALEIADVQIVWRDDVVEGDDVEVWLNNVSLAPPVLEEALSIPVHAARAWLERREEPIFGDVEGGIHTQAQSRDGGKARRVLRWKGPEESVVVWPQEIRPGDTLVVPSAYGGCDEYGWKPNSKSPVTDIGDACWNRRVLQETADKACVGRSARLRIHPKMFRMKSDIDLERQEILNTLLKTLQEILTQWELGKLDLENLSKLVHFYLDFAVLDEFSQSVLKHVEIMKDSKVGLTPYTISGHRGFILFLRPRKAEGKFSSQQGISDFTDQDESSQFSRPISIEEHSNGVTSTVKRLCKYCGVSEYLSLLLEIATKYHDLGKAHYLFQILLHNGNELDAWSSEKLLAKAADPIDKGRFFEIREAIGLPKDFRHEFISVALLQCHPDYPGSLSDPELVAHLIGTHHGRGRPFPSVNQETEAIEVEIEMDGYLLQTNSDHGFDRLGSGWVEQFWALNKRYGPWGLAYLEALTRQADRIQSRRGA